jgi:hypothetical protein
MTLPFTSPAAAVLSPAEHSKQLSTTTTTIGLSVGDGGSSSDNVTMTMIDEAMFLLALEEDGEIGEGEVLVRRSALKQQRRQQESPWARKTAEAMRKAVAIASHHSQTRKPGAFSLQNELV